jgi:hypothetical protein
LSVGCAVGPHRNSHFPPRRPRPCQESKSRPIWPTNKQCKFLPRVTIASSSIFVWCYDLHLTNPQQTKISSENNTTQYHHTPSIPRLPIPKPPNTVPNIHKHTKRRHQMNSIPSPDDSIRRVLITASSARTETEMQVATLSKV